MDRRSLLLGAGALLAGQSLAACSAQQNGGLSIRLLKSSIPVQLPTQFRQSLKQSSEEVFSLDLSPEVQLSTLFALLETWKKAAASLESGQGGFSVPFVGGRPSRRSDLVTLGDAWLAEAIRKDLIQPLDTSRWKNWQNVPEPWKALVTRDRQGQPSPSGQVWGAPYRWGTTVIAYRVDQFRTKGWPVPTDWADLWRPELKGRISLLDQGREVIGLTLKKLGLSYNTADLTSVPALERELQSLHRQVKVYSSNAYLQPLLLDDTDVAVGWSTDVLPIAQTNPNVAVVVPASGTRLWSELWVRPFGADQAALTKADRWIDFCWQPDMATALSLLSDAASPVMANPKQAIPTELQKNQALLPSAAILQRSEFLYPLSEPSLQQYRAVWSQIRQAQAA